MAEFTKITVNINKTLWAAFNLFAHSSFAIRRDALISTWIYRFFNTSRLDQMPHLRDEIPSNDVEWKSIVRDLRRTFKKSLKPAVITLHTGIADQLNDFCDEKAINRDRFIEQLIYRALIDDQRQLSMRNKVQKESVLYIGPLDMMIGILLQMPYRAMHEFPTQSYLLRGGWDEPWSPPRDDEWHPWEGDTELPSWLDGLLLTDADQADRDNGILPKDKIMVPPLGYWVFLRGYRHHLVVPGAEYEDPSALRQHIKKHFSELVSPPVFERLIQSLAAFPQSMEPLDLLEGLYKLLAHETGVRDLGFEEPYDFDELVFSGPKLF